jgi:hypothetical protein
MAKLTEPNIPAGKREDLADLIVLLDAKQTPLLSMTKKGAKPGNTLMRWQVDSLPDAEVKQGVVDGTDEDLANVKNFVKDGEAQYRYELSNHIQEFRKTVRVSPLTLDIANTAGVRDELSNNIAKGTLMLKRDVEKTFSSANLPKADNGVNQGYVSRGLDAWVKNDYTGDTYLTVPTQFRTPVESIDTTPTAELADVNIQDVLTSIYDNTGIIRDYDLLCGTALKRAFTNLTNSTKVEAGEGAAVKVQTFNRDASSSQFIQSVDFFEGDFGSLRLHTSHFLKATNVGYVIPFDLLEIRYGGDIASISELTDNGGGPARLIKTVASLCCHNPLGFGKFDPSAD